MIQDDSSVDANDDILLHTFLCENQGKERYSGARLGWQSGRNRIGRYERG